MKKLNLKKAAIALALATTVASTSVFAETKKPDYLSAGLWGGAAIALTVVTMDASGIVLGMFAYANGKFDGILPDGRMDQVQIAWDDLSRDQRQALLEIVDKHAKEICEAQGMKPIYWQSLPESEAIKKLVEAANKMEAQRHLTIEELSQGGQQHQLYNLDDIEVHGMAAVVASGAAWKGVTCQQIASQNGVNLNSAMAPLEAFATDNGLKIRFMGSEQELTWEQAINAGRSMERQQQKSDF